MNRNTKLIGILLTCCCVGQCLVVGNNIKLKHKTIRLQDNNKFYKNQHKKITNENINLKSLNETLDKNNKILTKKNEDLRKSNESLLKENKELEYKWNERQQKISRSSDYETSGGDEFTVRLSYYTISYEDCGNVQGITASGKNLWTEQGNFIAAPSNIPFGTQIYIEELGETYEVVDRGGAITWENGIMKLDVFIPNATQEYLNELGVKYSKARILN